MKPFLFLVIQVYLVMAAHSQPTFTLGDTNNNYPVLVKQDGSHSYVLGQSDINGISYGTITKVETSTGNLIWQRRLDFPSQINDMVFIPPQGPLGKTSLYIVGHTLPFDANNASFLVQIQSETAALECSNIFNQTGRESFRKIVRNMNTPNPNFPYFILGSRGYIGGTIFQEKVILVNLRNGCSGGTNINFVKEYNFTNTPDIEFSKGMLVLNDGNMLLMGNETTNGFGMVIKINGAGNVVNAGIYTRNIEVLDAAELANGNILFSGKRTNNNIETGLLFVTDTKLTLQGQAFENTNVLSYQDIATTFSGEIYLPCFYKQSQNSNTTTFPIVQKLDIAGTSSNPLLSFIWQQSLETTNAALLYKGVSLSADFGNELVYTDGRGVNISSQKISFAKTNTSFTTICLDSVSTLLRPLALGFNNVEVSNVSSSLPSPTQGSIVGKDWAKSDFCAEPCQLDFTISTTERECNNVLCNINITNGSLPYTLSWDFNCDGTIDATGIPAQYTYTSNGSHQVCIKVMDGKECVKEKSFTIITNGDGEAPVLTCPDNITIQCNAITDPSNTGNPTVTDNADSNPKLIPLDDLVTENTPCLKKIVRTWKAIDDCNYESTCTQVITIKDEISPVFISCGRKIEVQGIRDANGKCKEKVTLLAPAVTDQCDSNPSVVNSYTNTNNATADYNEGTTIVTWTATDQCGNMSVCRDTVVVNCDPCCINKQDFIDRVENAVTTTLNIQDCEIYLSVSGLLSCDVLKSINWGDGNVENGPFVFPLTHSFSVNGNYTINCFFQENNSNGNGCFEQNVTLPIDIECCECNTSENEIIIQNEKICFIDETPEYLKISDNHNLEQRWLHSAIWTGSEMIVWGGRSWGSSITNYYQNGARYNPNSDTWQSTSVNNAPLPRSGHSAIWTGSEMIVWGGVSSTGINNTGGIYNPITDTWQSISTVNAPLPRSNHVALWTGSEMIIWGGGNSVGFNDGGIYNPSTDTWRLIQPLVINFTYRDLAVWTGDELIVFSDQDKILHYNITNNSWSQFSRPAYNLTFSSVIFQDSHIYFYSNIESSFENIVGYKYNILTHDFINFDLANAPDIDLEPKAYYIGKHIVYFDWDTDDEPNINGYLYDIEHNKFEDYKISVPVESRAWGSIVYGNSQFMQWGGRRTIPNPGPNAYNDGYIIKNIYKSLSDTLICDPNEITNLPCPLSDSPHSFTIDVACDNGCESENITWQIKDPNNITIKSGTNTNGFVVTLSQGEVTTNGQYTLEMEYYCGIDKCSCVSKMNFEDCLTSAQDIELDNQIKIYPNPTSGQFTMDFKNGNVAFDNALIYDLQGRWIKTIALAKGMAKQEIDLVQNENGMYLVRLIDKEGTSLIRKIVKVN